MFYNDGRHPLIYQFEPPIRVDELEIAVDELAGTPVDAVMFCLGDGRTVLHDSGVGELWGHNVASWPHVIFHRAHRSAKGLIDAGHDPLRVVCDRAHAKGMRFYPTLLVQQGRGDGDDDVRCSEFRFANTHLEIGADGALPPEHPGARCLDFTHAEVRDERFALIEETLDRYPVDGFELQLAYRHWYFRPDAVDAGRRTMTEWIERVRTAVKAGGAERELVVRVPASIDGCRGSGLDVEEWLRLGLVDVVVAETFGGPEVLDSTMDLRPLVAAARSTRGRVQRRPVPARRLRSRGRGAHRDGAGGRRQLLGAGSGRPVPGLLARGLAVRRRLLRDAARAAAPGRDGRQGQGVLRPYRHRPLPRAAAGARRWSASFRRR